MDVGCNGRISDGGVFANSYIFKALEEKSLNIPNGKLLPGRENPLPYLIVGDEAFPLKNLILQDNWICPKEFLTIKRVVENVFGILASRFRVFKSTIDMEPENCFSLLCSPRFSSNENLVKSKIHTLWNI